VAMLTRRVQHVSIHVARTNVAILTVILASCRVPMDQPSRADQT
jgi:hypothetical protein